MLTVSDVNALIVALQPLVTHARKVQADIGALEALREDETQAALVTAILGVVSLLTLGKLKSAVNAFLAEVEPKAEAVKTLELK